MSFSIASSVLYRAQACSPTVALRTPSVKNYFDATEYELLASTPEQAAALIKTDYERYAKVVKELGLRMD